MQVRCPVHLARRTRRTRKDQPMLFPQTKCVTKILRSASLGAQSTILWAEYTANSLTPLKKICSCLQRKNLYQFSNLEHSLIVDIGLPIQGKGDATMLSLHVAYFVEPPFSSSNRGRSWRRRRRRTRRRRRRRRRRSLGLLRCPDDLRDPAVDPVGAPLANRWVEHAVLGAVVHALLSRYNLDLKI